MKTRRRRVASQAAFLVVATVAAVVLLRAAGVGGHSADYPVLRAQPSWLQYLPPPDRDHEPRLIALNSDDAAGAWTRRVDFVVRAQDQPVSLCFGRTRTQVMLACPGARFLGWTTRPVRLRAVAEVGSGPGPDWLAMLDRSAPTLAEADQMGR